MVGQKEPTSIFGRSVGSIVTDHGVPRHLGVKRFSRVGWSFGRFFLGRGFPLAIALFWIGSVVVYAVTQASADTSDRGAFPRATLTQPRPVHPPILAALARNPEHPRRPPVAQATPRPTSIVPRARIAGDRLIAAVEYLSRAPSTSPGLAFSPQKPAHPAKAPPSTPRPSATVGPAHILQVWVTGYDLYGTTATGVPAGPGICAVDPYTIPLGTHITIAGVGTCVAADTGPNIVGARIDVWVPDYQTALNLTGLYTASW